MIVKRKGLREHNHARLVAEVAKLNLKEERKLAEDGLSVFDDEKLKVAKMIIWSKNLMSYWLSDGDRFLLR